jgi:hypothetical protein
VRHLSSLNLDLYTPEGTAVADDPRPFTTVYQSVTGANRGGYNSGSEAWAPFIRTVTTIDHITGPTPSTPKGSIYLRGDDAAVSSDIDIIIFATGYNNSLPFAKAADAPWSSANVLDEVIGEDERVGGDQWEVGGVKGLRMVGLDELLLFLRNDRTIAFPGLRKSDRCSREFRLISQHTKSFPSLSPRFKLVYRPCCGLVYSLPFPPILSYRLTQPTRVPISHHLRRLPQMPPQNSRPRHA